MDSSINGYKAGESRLFCSKIRELRGNLTIKEISSKTGLSASLWYQWENKPCRMRFKHLLKIKEYFNIDVSDLILEKPNRNRKVDPGAVLKMVNDTIVKTGTKYGSLTEAAHKFNVTRERIRQIIECSGVDASKHPAIGLDPYKPCLVCGAEAPKNLLKYGICVDCIEFNVKKCPDCGSGFLFNRKTVGRAYCPDCSYKRIKPYLMRYKAEQKYPSCTKQYMKDYYQKMLNRKKIQSKNKVVINQSFL